MEYFFLGEFSIRGTQEIFIIKYKKLIFTTMNRGEIYGNQKHFQMIVNFFN
jgi:hypothetical protein